MLHCRLSTPKQGGLSTLCYRGRLLLSLGECVVKQGGSLHGLCGFVGPPITAPFEASADCDKDEDFRGDVLLAFESDEGRTKKS